MTKADISRRLLDPDGLDAVREAFSGVDRDDPRYTWSADPTWLGETIQITGIVKCGDEQVGRFTRRLLYASGHRRAEHSIFELERDHYRNKVALWHYRKCFAYYVDHGFRYVEMEAERLGTFVWPQFGFDLRRRVDKDKLLSILKRLGVPKLPTEGGDLFAPDIALTELDGKLIGQSALEMLRDETDRAIPMVLDFEDSRQRRFLTAADILEGRP